MKVKVILLVMLLSALCFSSYAKAGLGCSYTYNLSTKSRSMVSFTARTDKSPWCVSFNAFLQNNGMSLYLDNWFVNERLAEHLDYYVLWGMNFGAVFDDDNIQGFTGARFGAGLDFFLLKRHLEIFTQFVWNPYFGIDKTDWNFSPIIRPVNFPCTAGIRIWF